MASLEAIRFVPGFFPLSSDQDLSDDELKRAIASGAPARLSVLDQLGLPTRTRHVPVRSAADAFDAIKTMTVRGAPAIAIVAALGLAVELEADLAASAAAIAGGDGVEQAQAGKGLRASAAEQAEHIRSRLAYLVGSRPTAVNLGRAAADLGKVVENAAKEEGPRRQQQQQQQQQQQLGAAAVVRAYSRASAAMLEADVADNKAIGSYGVEWILNQSGGDRVRVLTHCNTGSLATAGYGTALGIIRALHETKRADGTGSNPSSSSALKHAFCTETRPYNQGARLTAYELMTEQIPCTLVTDSMACALLSGAAIGASGGPERWGGSVDEDGHASSSPFIDAIVVGADRVAANGDTANKIGTHGLAVLARHHSAYVGGDAADGAGARRPRRRTRFVVAAPWTTIDLATRQGSDIVVEERAAAELVTLAGAVGPAGGSGEGEDEGEGEDGPGTATIRLAPAGMPVWNPSFDVTPAALIDAIVTERGVVEKGPDGRFDLAGFVARLSGTDR